VLGKYIDPHSELPDTHTKPPAARQPAFTNLLLQRAPVKLLVDSAKKQKDMTEIIRCVKGVLDMDMTLYPMERDSMHFSQLYLAGDTSAS
jgi:hypothetical protein